MKIVIDLDHLLAEGKITEGEYKRFRSFAQQQTSSLAYNILIGFGIVAVSLASLSLLPSAMTAIVVGLLLIMSGVGLFRISPEHWKILAYICVLVGALMSGAGLFVHGRGSTESVLLITVLFTATSVLVGSAFFAVLAVLASSIAMGSMVGYLHASYFLLIREPLMTIFIYGVLAGVLYGLSRSMSPRYERLALAATGASVFLVNFGFWIGSLWGDKADSGQVLMHPNVFAVIWAVALVAAAVFAWKIQRRWLLNTVTVFGGIHFFTQWFRVLKLSAGSVMVAGLLILLLAIAMRVINSRMRSTAD